MYFRLFPFPVYFSSLQSPISFPPRVSAPYVIALEIVAEISPLSMTSVCHSVATPHIVLLTSVRPLG